MSDYRKILKREFEGADGSFIIQLGAHNTWDKVAFVRLATAMRAYCETDSGTEMMERWIAAGFFDTYWDVDTWMAQDYARKVYDDEYYQAALQLLHMLAIHAFYRTDAFADSSALDKLIKKVSE